MHAFELVDEVVVAVLQRCDIEFEGRDVLPVRDIKQFKDVSNIILLIESLLVCIRESLQNVAHFSQVLDKLFH